MYKVARTVLWGRMLPDCLILNKPPTLLLLLNYQKSGKGIL